MVISYTLTSQIRERDFCEKQGFVEVAVQSAWPTGRWAAQVVKIVHGRHLQRLENVRVPC